MKHISAHLIAVFTAIIIFVVSIFFFRNTSREWVVRSSIPEILPHVVMIIEKGNTIGAGTVIFPEKWLILTSRHLVSSPSSLTVRSQEGTLYPVVHMFPGKGDVALLQIVPDDMIRSLGVPHIIWSQNDLQRGDFVTAFGALSQSNSIVLSQGIISDPRQKISLTGKKEDENYFIQTDINTQSGFSGGPLIDQQWNIIGINTATLGTHTNISWGTSVTESDIQTLVQ